MRAVAGSRSGGGSGSPLRLGTYSIVARDPGSGELGVAVQSHWFSVGSVVTWAEGGVGAVATQAMAQITYGPGALSLLREGADAPGALAELLAADRHSDIRQVAIVDAHGGVATHTGVDCIEHAGHITGEQVSCQANIMVSESVWPAMLEAYHGATGPLAQRLLTALDAGEAAGGDARGRQSAALLVVPAVGEPWERVATLRVDDHPEPLRELRRLLALRDAYRMAEQAELLAAEGDHDAAAELHRRAAELAPGSHELLFWGALAAAQAGDMASAVLQAREAISMRPAWLTLLSRLPQSVAPAAPALLRALDQR
jgi:uncharacterized Ntn-hydrolase superfamily protein